MPNYNYKIKLQNIRAFAFDVDGVMTDGSVISTADGDLLRTFNSKDGFAIRMCVLKGYPVAIITGGRTDSIYNRFVELGIPAENIYQKSRNKIPDFEDFCKRHNLSAENVVYCGDDLPDIPIMKVAGLSACPEDAVPEVKNICEYISIHKGGHGFVRDIIEQVMKVHGDWYLEVDKFANRF